MNEVSIIINGVRFDTEYIPPYASKCAHCDVVINAFCCAAGERDLCEVFRIGEHCCFRKSDKKGKDVKPKDNGQEDKQED